MKIYQKIGTLKCLLLLALSLMLIGFMPVTSSVFTNVDALAAT